VSSRFASAIAELRLQRDVIDRTIRNLEVLSHLEVGSVATVVSPSTYTAVADPPQRALPPARSSTSRPIRRVKTTRTSRAATAPPTDDTELLAQVKRAGGSIKPKDLATALHCTLFVLRQRTAPLLKSGQLVATGATMSRRLSLPGKSAKEAP